MKKFMCILLTSAFSMQAFGQDALLKQEIEFSQPSVQETETDPEPVKPTSLQKLYATGGTQENDSFVEDAADAKAIEALPIKGNYLVLRDVGKE